MKVKDILIGLLVLGTGFVTYRVYQFNELPLGHLELEELEKRF